MSRIGRQPVAVPAGVTTTLSPGTVVAKGAKGELSLRLPEGVEVTQEGQTLVVHAPATGKNAGAVHGLSRSLVANLIQGVHKGFQRELQLVGVGYRAAVKGQDVEFALGFSHPVVFPLPSGVGAQVEGNQKLTLMSMDKQLLGQVAADIRALRPPEPYKGKGVRYADEHVRRKAGKSAKK
ncbi:MAG: 50S ribosomal protein L6 [Nitrospirae bacterium CG18_big_fil_WC_8_21_14_2_50_70_55]|nr:50S ribosomal protein L6 [Deltaproteobacteria bacterium]OIP67010.1 MAG: 50S ribosomal protein L6 [Nitrospirae bacterium CG2_30_70_394]PIQ07277.1 MAG: 50S ribosomal protein L6 [Nitrospirae bacterium CG18_big_fil_WC_8_21_14_2_50_70_55]PIU80142.1 MAG: 50S ribosomal protein L6 [Nitrospirae bacterium CG06_land_8_20_14_3_00_70_43]PIW82683.1 MAG: 50S ribosomal protein L6 [Nitrospirae bacterium CG_4_8_14_3_um_filter_70_85]PIX84038.1 MAG: 50S ribosomal protein L6 [Nitrospirae bacterium CG_4_10_14_3_